MATGVGVLPSPGVLFEPLFGFRRKNHPALMRITAKLANIKTPNILGRLSNQSFIAHLIYNSSNRGFPSINSSVLCAPTLAHALPQFEKDCSILLSGNQFLDLFSHHLPTLTRLERICFEISVNSGLFGRSGTLDIVTVAGV